MIVAAATIPPAVTLLRDLGDTRDQVAATLTQLGCRGDRNNCLACPIAVYLLRAGLGAVQVLVGDLEAELIYPAGRTEFVDLPEPVAAFVAGFDTGMYEQLVKPVTAGGSSIRGQVWA
jgi:hypothetical protein